MPRRPPFVLVVALAAACAASPVSAAGNDRAEAARINIKRLEESIQRQEELLGQNTLKERSLLEEMERLDMALDEQRARLEELQARQADQRARIDERSRELEELDEGHKERREGLMRRLRAYYLTGNTGLFNALFSSATVSELALRNESFRALATHDRELFRRFRESTAEIGAAKEALAREHLRLDTLIEEADEQRRRLLSAAEEQRRFVDRVRAERGLHEQAIREMNRARRQLEGTLHRMAEDEKQRGVRNFVANRGKLPPPVRGPLVRGFMEPGSAEEEAGPFANGITIGVSEEQEVRAVYGGVVIYADYMPGYGKMVIIEHADQHYTVTAKFSKIQVGEKTKVAQGDVLGLTDSFATLIGKGLYFEVRRGAVAEDPLKWLKPGSTPRQAATTTADAERTAEAILGTSAALPASPVEAVEAGEVGAAALPASPGEPEEAGAAAPAETEPAAAGEEPAAPAPPDGAAEP